MPPFLFYFHQFYPEMLGAIVLALAFRTIALRPERIRLHPWRLGALLAVLPWLHQKFLPVWGVLLATALLVGWRSPAARVLDRSGWKWAARVLAPNVVGLYLFALYNFAVTGSARPDALFLAWGPRGVSSERIGQGVLGLLLDARFGILPYVPLLLLAGAGLVLGGARRFAVILPAAAAYYLTVASADNWSGAVCNLGRYVMPLVPLGVALVGIAIARVDSRRGAMTLVLALASWTALLALALRQDPHAANDSALLLARSTYADGLQYIPALFIRTWADASPGPRGSHPRLAAPGRGRGVLAPARGHEQGDAGRSPLRALAGIAATLLLVGLALERADARNPHGPEVALGDRCRRGGHRLPPRRLGRARGRGHRRPRRGRDPRPGARLAELDRRHARRGRRVRPGGGPAAARAPADGRARRGAALRVP